MRRTTTITRAATSRMWMNPPRVYELTRPSAQSTSRRTAIVHSKKGVKKMEWNNIKEVMIKRIGKYVILKCIRRKIWKSTKKGIRNKKQ